MARVAVNPCRKALPPTGPISPPQKKPTRGPKGSSMHVIYQKRHKCLALAARKRIYLELVRYQDTHAGQDEKAYVVVAKRWRIPSGAAKKIAFEGASRNWPLPPLP
jgi:hypothetical protein